MMSTPLGALAALTLFAGSSAATPIAIPFQSFKLSNGLQVILSEDHSAPIVGVHLTYDVGSKDERPGRTGFTHLFEHLRFESEHLSAADADRLIEGRGGSSNGATSSDRTEYWEQVPSSELERMLFIESDRMGFLLPTLTQAKLDNQREVVRNERRQSYEMQPYGTAWVKLAETLWDPSFPYHWLPIGSHQDLEAATLEDMRDFFERYCGPNNASLAIVGDIHLEKTRALVEKWFGSIPAGATVQRSYPSPKPLAGEKRVRVEDRVQMPRLYLAWQSPKAFTPDDAALTILEEILTSGKSARLTRRLVMKEQIAQLVAASQQGEALAGTFLVVATPKPGVSLEQLEREIDEELARITQQPPSPEELERARNKLESQMILALEPMGGFGSRAAVLNEYYWGTGDPGFFPKDLARYLSVTAEDVQAAAARWLGKNRVVLTVVPQKGRPPPHRTTPRGGKRGKRDDHVTSLRREKGE